MSLRARPILLMVCSGLASSAFAQGPTYTFFTLDNPSANCGPESACTIAYGINNAGQIVGYYFNAGHHGFLYSNGNFTTLDDPQAAGVGTNAHGINASGQIVGSYNDGNSNGFLYIGGNFFTLDEPLAGLHGYTSASGINASGQIVGSYAGYQSICNGAFLDSGGAFSEFNFSPLTCPTTTAYGINDAGQIVGSYVDTSGTHGFLYNGSNGTFSAINDPLANGGTGGTVAYGINNAGQIVGSYVDASGGSHGFLYSNGTFTTIDDPLAQ
jgi:probable HAF family extracellular repeat protein